MDTDTSESATLASRRPGLMPGSDAANAVDRYTASSVPSRTSHVAGTPTTAGRRSVGRWPSRTRRRRPSAKYAAPQDGRIARTSVPADSRERASDRPEGRRTPFLRVDDVAGGECLESATKWRVMTPSD
jgi:hypothetical protein